MILPSDSRKGGIVHNRGRVSVFLVFLFGITVGLLALYLALTGGEVRESRYSDYDEARSSADDAWLPPGLPASATLIHEWHDLDTNLRLGSFRFDPEDDSMNSVLRPEFPLDARIDRDPSFASPVPRDPTIGQLEELGFEFFAAQDVRFAIQRSVGIAYFWNSES